MRAFLPLASSIAVGLLVAACSSDESPSPGTTADSGPTADSGTAAQDASEASDGSPRDAPRGDASDADNRDATDAGPPASLDPDSAPRAVVDRFSEDAASLMVRTKDNGLPGPGEPVDFDGPPFLHRGLGPNGEHVQYYNFDIRPQKPATMYVFKRATGEPVAGQLPVVAALPGDPGYNDFYNLTEVVLPDDYPPNSVTSAARIDALGLEVTSTDTLVNRPIVSEGSTATHRFDSTDPDAQPVWYEDTIAHYFQFENDVRSLRANDGSLLVNLSNIYVTFNINAGQPGGGPPSGFVTEPGTNQTHNVVDALPTDSTYSPLWLVIIYDNADFASVSDLSTAMDASIVPGVPVPDVNCPLVVVE